MKRPALASRLFRVAGSLALAAASLVPATSSGYAIQIHNELARRALLKSNLGDPASPISPAAFDQLRSIIDTYARNEPTLRDAWVKRYPTAANFDAFAEKQLLQLAASSKIFGIDAVDERLKPGSTLLDVVSWGAGQPDDDWRNRERLAYDDKRQPLKDKYGQPVPADPALLNMGRLGALSSQAHAHYGLAQVEFSGDADVLKKEPKRFARAVGWEKGPIITLAAEMAQIHLDMALVAALSDVPTARELSWQFTGDGFHYMGDVGNQIHTVQVGLYDFFVDAAIERIKMGLLSGGGYLGKMRSLGSIGIDILSNHHTLSEEFTYRRFKAAVEGKATPETERLLSAPTEDDPEFAKKLDEALAKLGPNPERGEFALVLTRTMIDVSSDQGDDVYRATAGIADPALRTRHKTFDEEHDDPEKFVRPRDASTESAYRDFWALQEQAFRRVGTAKRRWVQLQQKILAQATTPEQKEALRKELLKRLLDRQLKMLSDSDARLAQYLADPPQNITAPEKAPELLAVDLVAAGLLVGIPLLIMRRRRSQQQAKPAT